jgi:cytoskeletal protein CcmA (bactofilin family)
MWLKTKKPESAVAALKKGEIPSVLSRDISILGAIVSDGAIDFSGNLEGNVRCQTMTLRAEGVITGEITAESVFVYGNVKGTIRARDVYLFSTCRIEGSVMHENISIEDGAFIDGNCTHMSRPNTPDVSAVIQDKNTRDILESLRLSSSS